MSYIYPLNSYHFSFYKIIYSKDQIDCCYFAAIFRLSSIRNSQCFLFSALYYLGAYISIVAYFFIYCTFKLFLQISFECNYNSVRYSVNFQYFAKNRYVLWGVNSNFYFFFILLCIAVKNYNLWIRYFVYLNILLFDISSYPRFQLEILIIVFSCFWH